MRILVISPPLVLENYQSRWILMANGLNEEHSIRALVPHERRSAGYGEIRYITAKPRAVGNFELHPVQATSDSNLAYLIRKLRREIEVFNPDLIFCVHHETTLQLIQTILIRKLFLPKVNLVYFSMSAFARVPPLRRHSPREWAKRIIFGMKWWLIRKGTDGALCHYDRIEQQMRCEGYTKPILQQTQYGVDPAQFSPNPEAGVALREKLGLRGTVIGFCGRFVNQKGLRELLAAAENLEGEWSLLLVGDGDLREEVEAWIMQNAYEKRVHITGFVPHTEVQVYFQAMDVFYLGSKDSATYIDTFPLVVAQAMTMGIPVVGSDGGAIPYQLGGEGLVFPQGDVTLLQEHLQTLLDRPEKREAIGSKLRARARANYCIDIMNQKFVDFVQDKIFHD